ncbi:hypothetical protein HMPREF9946_02595 [Acetobacteraceae bacterium AT-5844]|nr:hypothetical protein HMPREF9946_02595 [Acetobacteraceae bacterium AT-5844]
MEIFHAGRRDGAARWNLFQRSAQQCLAWAAVLRAPDPAQRLAIAGALRQRMQKRRCVTARRAVRLQGIQGRPHQTPSHTRRSCAWRVPLRFGRVLLGHLLIAHNAGGQHQALALGGQGLEMGDGTAAAGRRQAGAFCPLGLGAFPGLFGAGEIHAATNLLPPALRHTGGSEGETGQRAGGDARRGSRRKGVGRDCH